MIILLWLFLGFVAGWLVNLAADLLPPRLPLRTYWYTPLWHLKHAFKPQPSLHSELSPRPIRTLVVWAIAVILSITVSIQIGSAIVALIVASYGWFLLAIAIIDLEHQLVLNRMLLASLPLVGFIILTAGMPRLTSALLGAAVGFGSFLILALLWPGGIGMGDVKLAGWIGLVVGYPAIIPALAIGVIVGGLAALIVLVAHRFRRGLAFAYAPYLAFGAWCTLLLGASNLA
ncbi:MAG: prepilin peptidase [Chloroflexi bacterium]|nr:MAG: prepilin peptidase [Chloroflexota bacterium]